MLKDRSSRARLTFGRLTVLLTVAALPMALAFGQKPPEDANKTPPAAGSAKANEPRGVERRAINKRVKDFPEKTDLSTPESAMAAWSRSLARRDIQAALDLSWVKLDVQTAKDVTEGLKHLLVAPKQFTQQVLDIEVVEVLTYKDDLAAVVHTSGLLPPKRPYGAQHFGRIEGKWMNLDWDTPGGLDVLPSVAAAQETFEKKKEDLWKSFVKTRNDVREGRTPVFQYPKGKQPQRFSISAAEKADIERMKAETWQMGIDLDMPSLQPQAVQFAILDEDPVPAFAARVSRMRDFYRQQQGKAGNEARRQEVRGIQMAVAWDLGFKQVTGDNLYLLTKRPSPDFSKTTMSSNRPAGKKWVVTKTVRIEGQPVCWCIPVEVKKGESIDVTFDKGNTFDLRAAYDPAMQGPAGVAAKPPSAPARKADAFIPSEFPYAVKFEQGAKRFLTGDTIAILEVRGTADTFAPGNIYWIKGTYTLASRDRATLAAYTTAKDAANAASIPWKAQSTVVTKGSGTFTLFLPMSSRGWPHVSFYPPDGGESFGGSYFGTGDSVLKRWWGAEETER